MTDLDKRLEAKEQFTPETGANLVGLDDFEAPGEELYLVGNFPTKQAAEFERARRLKETPNEKLFVYEARS